MARDEGGEVMSEPVDEQRAAFEKWAAGTGPNHRAYSFAAWQASAEYNRAAGVRDATERAAKITDKLTDPLIVAEKMPNSESPLQIAELMKALAAAIRNSQGTE